MLGLPHAGMHLAAGIERHRHPARDQSGLRLVDGDRGMSAWYSRLELNGRQAARGLRSMANRALLAGERATKLGRRGGAIDAFLNGLQNRVMGFPPPRARGMAVTREVARWSEVGAGKVGARRRRPRAPVPGATSVR